MENVDIMIRTSICNGNWYLVPGTYDANQHDTATFWMRIPVATSYRTEETKEEYSGNREQVATMHKEEHESTMTDQKYSPTTSLRVHFYRTDESFTGDNAILRSVIAFFTQPSTQEGYGQSLSYIKQDK